MRTPSVTLVSIPTGSITVTFSVYRDCISVGFNSNWFDYSAQQHNISRASPEFQFQLVRLQCSAPGRRFCSRRSFNSNWFDYSYSVLCRCALQGTFQFQLVRLQSVPAVIDGLQSLVSIPTGSITVYRRLPSSTLKACFNSNWFDYSAAEQGISRALLRFQFQLVRLQSEAGTLTLHQCPSVSIPTGSITVPAPR